jgi:hypothetical protein
MRFGKYTSNHESGNLCSSSSHLAWMVQPRNYLLFACHLTNATAQTVQDVRFVKYWHYGGREQKYGITRDSIEVGTKEVKGEVTKAIEAAREEAKKVAGK